MTQNQRLRYDTTRSLFAQSREPGQIQQTVRVEFDGGTPSNIPRLGYGIGYGSFKVDDHEVVRCDHGRAMSANAAEIWTLVRALEFVTAHNNPANVRLEIHGDSKIALYRCRGRSEWKAKNGAPSVEFKNACTALSALCDQFSEVQTHWRGREVSVALFGH